MDSYQRDSGEGRSQRSRRRELGLWLLGIVALLVIGITLEDEAGIPLAMTVRIAGASICLLFIYRLGRDFPGEQWPLDLVGCQYWYLLHAVGRSPNFSRRTYVVRASRRYCRAGCHVGRTNGLLSGRRCASARRASADNTWSRSGHRFLRDPLHASAHRPAHRPFDTALMAGMGRKRTLARAPPIPLSYLELPCLAPVHGTEEPTWTACLKVDEVEEVEEPLFPTGTVNQLRQDRQLRQLWEPVLP